MQSTYFDLQVNGFGGVDFNQDDLTPGGLEQACQRLQNEGVGSILATIITDTIDRMEHRLRKIAQLREQSDLCRTMVAGIHIEGPFLSPVQGYRGAHPLDAILPANVDLMNRLLEATGGLAKLVTLAPEHDQDFRVTKMLTSQGIRVSAGHCDPSLDQLRGAIDAGVSLFTHLGNGCPMQMHRHDNIIQRVLSLRDKLWICFIADCVHVPVPALAHYLPSDAVDPTTGFNPCHAAKYRV